MTEQTAPQQQVKQKVSYTGCAKDISDKKVDKMYTLHNTYKSLKM